MAEEHIIQSHKRTPIVQARAWDEEQQADVRESIRAKLSLTS